jgi:L-asparagine transporter-like permease
MEISNFWFYTIMIVVILHVIVGFVYLLFKLSPKKKDKQ